VSIVIDADVMESFDTAFQHLDLDPRVVVLLSQ
jgi:hypothetical protein